MKWRFLKKRLRTKQTIIPSLLSQLSHFYVKSWQSKNDTPRGTAAGGTASSALPNLTRVTWLHDPGKVTATIVLKGGIERHCFLVLTRLRLRKFHAQLDWIEAIVTVEKMRGIVGLSSSKIWCRTLLYIRRPLIYAVIFTSKNIISIQSLLYPSHISRHSQNSRLSLLPVEVVSIRII